MLGIRIPSLALLTLVGAAALCCQNVTPVVDSFQLVGPSSRTRHQRQQNQAARTNSQLFSSPTRQSRVNFLSASSVEEDGGSSAASPSKKQVSFDWSALAKYATAIVVQMSLGFGILTALDQIVKLNGLKVPFAVNTVFFYFMALKSRVLNPLANNRPQVKTLETKQDNANPTESPKRVMPRWTPPGFVFPIVWLLVIGPIRAVTSAMICTQTSHYACGPILALLLHLSIGDVWNTINNVERRYGTSVTGVVLVWLSKAHAAYQFTRVHTVAGRVLALSLIWLTIATALVTATWRLNPDPATGHPEPLYPVQGSAQTQFAWFSNGKQ